MVMSWQNCVRRERDRQQIAVVENLIDAAFSFLRIASSELELGNRARVDELLSKARVAYQQAADSLRTIDNFEEQQRLRDRHWEIDARIWSLERRIQRQ